MFRRCSSCKCEKEADCFFVNTRAKSGLDSRCKLCRQAYNQAYRARPEFKAQAQQYRIDNHETHIRVNREYQAQQYATNPNFRLASLLRSRLNRALEGKFKSGKTLDLLGCSIGDLRAHLENQFAEGMSWDNQGEWHIDHKRPCSSFDLTDPEQQKECCHFSNLQPLWAIDNLIKSNHHVEN